MTVDLPTWVPAVLKSRIAVYGFGDEVSLRLLTDSRMKRVWEEISVEAIKFEGLERLQRVDRLYEIGGFSEKEQALAAIYAISVREFNSEFFATKSKVAVDAKRWRAIAQECRSIKYVDFAPMGDPVLASSLERTALHFETLAAWLESRKGARWLGNESKNEGLTRARVSALIAASDDLFVNRLRTPLAILASVGLASDIDAKKIDNWRFLMS